MAYKIRELVNTLENLFKDFDKEVLVGIPSDNSDNPVIKLVPLRVVQVGAMDQKALLIAEHRLLPEPEKSCETCLHCESDENGDVCSGCDPTYSNWELKIPDPEKSCE